MTRFLIILVLFFSLGCAGKYGPNQAAPEKSFEQTVNDYLSALQQKNLAAIEDIIATNHPLSFVLPAKFMAKPIFKDRTEIMAGFKTSFADPNYSITFERVFTSKSSRMGLASVIADATFSSSGKNKTSARLYISFLFVQEKGHWRLIHDQNTLLESN